jgi:hypothetical protein
MCPKALLIAPDKEFASARFRMAGKIKKNLFFTLKFLLPHPITKLTAVDKPTTGEPK